MQGSDLCVGVITFNRSELLDKLLRSLEIALSGKNYPIYIFIQEMQSHDQNILMKYQNMITEVIKIQKLYKDVEHQINSNRILCWRWSFNKKRHRYLLCLEDDVEVAPDIFEITESIIKQNEKSSDFRGINFGSFETSTEPGTYSLLRYGIHGPASLISFQTYKKFKVTILKMFRGRIAWDSWVEPILKRGYMATCNSSRYVDKGFDGTHTSLHHNAAYFIQIQESFRTTTKEKYYNVERQDVSHSWRQDCVIYDAISNKKYRFQGLKIRLWQFYKAVF